LEYLFQLPTTNISSNISTNILASASKKQLKIQKN
jgi:hypothetical protein